MKKSKDLSAIKEKAVEEILQERSLYEFLDENNIPSDVLEKIGKKYKRAETTLRKWVKEELNKKLAFEISDAAQSGNTEAMFRLGCIYIRSKDYPKAEEWLKKAAKAGSLEALSYLVKMYNEKKLKKENCFQEIDLLKQAVDNGISDAYSILSQCYLKMAQNGDIASMYELGKFYYFSNDNQYYDEAEKWFKKVVDSNYSEAEKEIIGKAMVYIGVMCANKIDNLNGEPVEWFLKAKELNSTEAILRNCP